MYFLGKIALALAITSSPTRGAELTCGEALASPSYTRVLIHSNSQFPQMNALIHLSVLAHFLKDLTHVAAVQEILDDQGRLDRALLQIGKAMTKLHQAHSISHRDSSSWDPEKDFIEHRVPTSRLYSLYFSPYERVGLRIIEPLLSSLILERTGTPFHASFNRYIETKSYKNISLKAYLYEQLGESLSQQLLGDLKLLSESLDAFTKSPEVNFIAEKYRRTLSTSFQNQSPEGTVLVQTPVDKKIRILYQKHLFESLKSHFTHRSIENFFNLSMSQF